MFVMKHKNKIFAGVSVAILLIVYQNCSGSGGGSTTNNNQSAAVTGLDYSGTYKLNGVACYNRDLKTLTTSAAVSGSNETITISGNSYSSNTISGNCNSASQGTIKFVDSSTLNLTSIKTTSATGGSCTLSLNLSQAPANTIIPTGLSQTVTANETKADVVGASYIRNDSNGMIGLLSTFRNSANSEDICLMIYARY